MLYCHPHESMLRCGCGAQVHGSRIAVYGLGSWFVPCMFEDAACHTLMARDVQQGRLREDLVGYHQYSGSWLAGIPKGK